MVVVGVGVGSLKGMPFSANKRRMPPRPKSAFLSGFLELAENLVIVFKPPLGFLGFGGKFGNLQIALAIFVSVIAAPSFFEVEIFQSCLGSNAVTTRIFSREL